MGRMEQRPVGGQHRQQRGQYAGGRGHSYEMRPYVDGNTARQMQAVPVRKRNEEPARRRAKSQRRVIRTAGPLNFSYVLFLAVAAVVVVMVCVNYLQLQSQSTAYGKTITSLESQLANLKLENDSAYDNLLSSVDLQKIKELAMNKLGMVYASESQIITYDSNQNDYVRQYSDVPAE